MKHTSFTRFEKRTVIILTAACSAMLTLFVGGFFALRTFAAAPDGT